MFYKDNQSELEAVKLLKRFKYMRISEIKEVVKKLIVISKNWPLFDVTLKDINQSFEWCVYHYTGGRLESLGLEDCPCYCYCINCEMVPEHPISKRMVEIATDITEENVLFKEGINNGK